MIRYLPAFCFFLLLFVAPASAASAVEEVAAELSAAPVDPLIAPSGQLIDERRQSDKQHSLHSLTLVSHRPNYLLGSYYFVRPQSDPFLLQTPGRDVGIQPIELKFQLSLKTMVVSDLVGKTGDLWVGYTNRSFWQALNSSRSSFFRDTNHEPEIWCDFATDRPLGALRFKGVNLGMIHQSNGQWGATSRSWNRIYTLFMFQQQDLYFAIKPWWRIPESRSNDDNRDIGKYLGNFELYALKDWRNQSLGIMLRNNLRFGDANHGALQLDYTFPLHNQMRGYLQYFSGYGESLIDYDHAVESLSIGIMLSNWL